MDAETQRSADKQRPFVGRDGELAMLRSHLGHGRLVLISGDPGIGKTRLVEELAAEARERRVQVRWGRCWEGDGAPAFWPWIEVVRGLVRHADAPTLRRQLGPAASEIAHLVADVRARLPDVPDLPRLDPKQSRFRLFDGITTFLKHTATTQPLVLVLEDLHWADASSLLLLQFLAREIEAVPLLLIGTLRDVDLDRAHPLVDTLAALRRNRSCEQLPLAGLSETNVRRYVELVAGQDTAERVAASLHRDTDGNPFFLGEIVRLLAREPRRGGPRDPRVFVVPDTVRDVIARRLRSYSAECIEVLRIASVIGHTFTVAVFQRLPELADRPLLDLLGEAMAGRLITETPGTDAEYRFTHALIRETLYDDLPFPRRIQHHRSIGQALEAHHGLAVDAHAAELAHHFLHAAAEGEADRAIDYAARAGAHATEVLAHEEAVEH